MALTVRPVCSSQELKQFVAFPWQVYGKDSPWVPPLKKEDLNLLSTDKHPFWETASRELFLAFRDRTIVGRIAAIVDKKYNSFAGERCGAFGFFEVLPDPEAAQALLQAAYTWLKEQGMDYMRGPLSPSTNYTCGLLVDGFQEPPGLMMPWNPSSYPEYFEQFHLRKEQDLFAYLIEKDKIELAPWLVEELQRIKEKNLFTCRHSSKETLQEDVRILFDIYKKSWAHNFGFSPLSPGEEEEMVKSLVDFADLRFFVLIYYNDIPVAGLVALPNFNPLLKRLNGSIGISAPWHFLRTKKLSRQGYRIMLFGMLDEYRLSGLPLLLLDFFLEQARAHPELQWVEGSWVLEDNIAVDDLIEDFCGKITKRYRIYRKEITRPSLF